MATTQLEYRQDDGAVSALSKNRPTLRLGVVGCGPRGMQALEAISRQIDPGQQRRLDITVFEPSPKLGAGHIYNPDQPKQLRMNFATQYIDFWKVAADQPTPVSGSLMGWLERRYPDLAASDHFIPRAVVGEYLHDCFDRVSERLRSVANLTIKPTRVRSIKSADGEWVVHDDSEIYHFDEVVLTTGHEGLRNSTDSQSLPRESFVFPVETNLSTEKIPSGSNVLVIGFGLTAIDAAIMLTEGRGGKFVNSSGIPTYIASNREPRRIEMRNRSGRPMLAKPTSQVEPIRNDFWDVFLDRLKSCRPRHGELSFQKDVWPVILDATAGLLQQSGRATSSADVDSWYRDWSRYKMDASSARSALLQSFAVATGQRPKDIPFALGEAWRKLYPEMVSLVSYGGLVDQQWPCFRRVSVEMERIAFGPPAESVGKLLRLIRNRMVTIGVCGAIEPKSHDNVISAVIASPQQPASDGPVAELIRNGDLQIDTTTGGILVSKSGHAIGGARGLAVFGRATEGWIVGNDTLSRTLHDQIEHWARTVAVALCKSIHHQ
tara:strand:+ start:203603 stop:205246 length:1644 start_codon:yes stop_codon:yes gene_type:complete